MNSFFQFALCDSSVTGARDLRRWKTLRTDV